jgi:AsmA protein
MRAVRIAAIAVAAVLVAVVAALWIGVPAPFAGAIIAKRFEAATGYRLTAGTPSVRLLPSVSVTLDGLAALDIGAVPQTRLTAERVRIEAPLSSLFANAPRLTEVVVTRPVLHAPLLRERTAGHAPLSSGRSGQVRTVDIAVDRMAIEDGAVALANRAGRVEGRIGGIAATGSLKPDRTLDIVTTGRVGEQAFRVALKGRLANGDGGAPFEFRIEAPGLLQDAVAGAAKVRATGSVLAIDELAGDIAQSRFSGSASVDFADKPFVKLDLDVQRLALAVVHPDAAVQGSLDQPWSDKPFSLEWLNFFDAEMQVSARELAVDRFRLAPVSVAAILTRGLLTGGVSKTGVYGGEAQGVVAVDVSNADQKHALRLDLVGVRAHPLLTDVASFSALDGRMQARIDVRGRGGSPREILSGLNGAVDVSVKDGEIRSVNIAKMIRSVGAGIVSGWQKDTAEKTDLTELSAFFRLEHGLASTSDFRLLGPLVRVTGTGTADIGAKTLQFRVEPKLVLSLEGQGGAADPLGIAVPVMVQGTWGAPRIYPDVAGILDNPDAAYAKLKELGAALLGSGAGTGSGQAAETVKPLMESIEAMVDRFSGKDKPAPRTQSPAGPPAPAPSRPRTSAPSQSQNAPTGLPGLFQGLFGR